MAEGMAPNTKAQWVERVLGVKIEADGGSDNDGLPGFKRRLAALMPLVSAAVAAGRPGGQELRAKLGEAGDFARKQDLAQAHAALDAAEAMLAAPAPSQPDSISPGETPAPRGLAGWRTARAAAMASLKALETAVRGMDAPERDAAVVLLRAIQANLTAEPVTPQQVAELQRYIETDDIIAEAEDPNGFGITVELRAPLLAALAGLRADAAGASAI
jgi:hypothetical protein